MGKYTNWKREELGKKVAWPMIVNVDNNQAKSFTENLNVNSKMRTTFNMKESWIHELRDKNIVKIQHIDTNKNPADIHTKPHTAGKFKTLLGMCNPIKILECVTL